MFLINLLFFHIESKVNIIQVWKGFIFSPFNFEFLLGALLAKYALAKNFNFGKTALFGGVSIFIAVWYFSSKTSSPILLTSMFCTASILMIYGGVGIDRSHDVQLPNIVNTIGNASYAIIIVNLPVIVAFSRIYEKLFPAIGLSSWGSWSAILLALLAATVGGVFTHRVIEPILLRLLRKDMTEKYVGKISR